MSDTGSAPAPRRRGRPAGATNRRPRVSGAELIATLNEQVMELIKENRRLKREVVKLSTGRAPVAANGADEKTLRILQRKVQRAVAAPEPTSRRRPATGGSRRRRSGSGSAPAPAAD
jgi:hypothetical protein